MTQRICSVDGCERKHVAKGLCPTHYNLANYTDEQRHPRFSRTCVTCGSDWLTPRRDAKYCSEVCYHFDKWGARTCVWPRAIKVKRTPKAKPLPFSEQRECAWCGDEFTARRADQRFCTADHKTRASRNRRRGRQHGSISHYTWAEFSRLFAKLGRCCAYCEQPIVGQPDPDHVVPLSKGGSNSITNILPACRPCNGDKRDLLLHEWAADRGRLGKPPRITTWATDDPRVRHLVDPFLAEFRAIAAA